MPSLGQTLSALNRIRRDAAAPLVAGRGGRLVARPFSPNPGDLRMLVHAPEGLAPDAPLVVVLHGCTQTAEAYAEGAGWISLADRFGFVVLCPEQTGAGNPNRCFNWFQTGDTTRDNGEAASIAAMVRQTTADHDIDPARVFITGLSAGGAMTATMLATYPELFAGGAVIAGLPHGAAANMSEAFGAMMQPQTLSDAAWGDKVRAASDFKGPWPSVSIWHGENDKTVRPASADALVRQWTNVHRVSAGPAQARTPDGRLFEVWMSKAGEPVVEHHRFPGMGHGAPVGPGGPDGCGSAGPFLLDVGTSSSREIALGWGIASAEPRARSSSAAEAPAQDAPKRASAKARPKAAAAPTDPVSQVIEKALRTAGLLK